MKKMIMIASLLTLITVATMAQSTPVVDQRQKNQRGRIVDGARSGELTRRETRQSVRDQRRIRRTERRAKADGAVTADERANLQRKQNKASRQLRRNKHDAQERPGTN